MQTQIVFLANLYCSEEFNQGLDNQIICHSMISILFGITAIFGNIVILIALHKERSLHQPSKVLLRNLVASDLSVGFVQLVFGAYEISILQRQWQICRLLYFVLELPASISIAVSLWTITVISVDRLLALLLTFRYRLVVTLKKVYAVAIASWVCNGIGSASLWFFSRNGKKVFSVSACYEFECFKWRVVCSPVRTQGCRKQQQGYLFHTNAIIPRETSQQHTLGF